MIERLCSRHLVLLGIGHTNAHVLRMWGMHPIPDTDLTCISDYPVATYSGMLPAVLAGQIPKEKMEIDLVRLSASVGARLITDRVTGLDHQRQEIQFDDRPSVPFDALSIGIGSVPTIEGVTIKGDSLIKIKPMQSFLDRLHRAIADADTSIVHQELRVVVVGAGVAGIEILFCLPNFAKTVTDRPLSLQLVTRSSEILPGVGEGTRRRISAEIQQRDISVATDRSVLAVTPDRVDLDDGTSIGADLVIWATGATAPPALGHLGLPLDDRGFIATDASLRSVSGEPIFAVGDTGSIVGQSLPKAGVYAVRQSPVLWNNIGRLLSNQPLQTYEPQSSFLKLINLGDGRGLGQWKGCSFSGRWVMKWKHHIDSRFMEMFQPGGAMHDSDEPMQCRGCGCKLGAEDLEQALRGDTFSLSADEAIPLEDAVEIAGGTGCNLIASTDFFSSPFDDAFLAGRVAALHSASDLIACGASVTSALANVVLPEGDSRSQRKALRDFLAGARLEFKAMGASIVGGHTIVGPRLETGFTVVGKPLGSELIRKGNLRVGDQLYLTKPIGIGVLLAAHMRNECRARDYASLIEAMLQRQHDFAAIAIDSAITAGTDVTGFGLIGHLCEMLDASNVMATVRIEAIPILNGVSEAIARGIESSLTPANRRAERHVATSPAIRSSALYQVLFDPQTCGGLLLGVAPNQASEFIVAVTAAGHRHPVCIGEVCDRGDHDKLLVIA